MKEFTTKKRNAERKFISLSKKGKDQALLVRTGQGTEWFPRLKSNCLLWLGDWERRTFALKLSAHRPHRGPSVRFVKMPNSGDWGGYATGPYRTLTTRGHSTKSRRHRSSTQYIETNLGKEPKIQRQRNRSQIKYIRNL